MKFFLVDFINNKEVGFWPFTLVFFNQKSSLLRLGEKSCFWDCLGPIGGNLVNIRCYICIMVRREQFHCCYSFHYVSFLNRELKLFFGACIFLEVFVILLAVGVKWRVFKPGHNIFVFLFVNTIKCIFFKCFNHI